MHRGFDRNNLWSGGMTKGGTDSSVALVATAGHASRAHFRALGWAAFATALALAMASAVYVRLDLLVSNVLFVDWYTYAHAVERVLSGSPLYSSQQLGGPYELPDVSGYGFAYPPSAVLILAPFASWPVGTLAWMVLNVFALVSGFAAVLRREFGRLDPWALALCTLGLAVFFPFGVGIATLNANVGLAGLFAWAWALQDSPALAPLIGLGGALKILPLATLGLAPGGRRIRAIAVAGAVLLVLVIASVLLVGVGGWKDYALALSNSVPACEGRLPSVACTLAPLGAGTAKAVGIAVAGVAFLGAWLVRSRLLAFALAGVAWLAPVTDMQYHYLLILYVVLVVAVARVVASRRARAEGAAIAVRARGLP